jgi:hypothetical protein
MFTKFAILLTSDVCLQLIVHQQRHLMLFGWSGLEEFYNRNISYYSAINISLKYLSHLYI